MRMRLLRAGDVHGAVKQFDRWSRADGKVLPGLAMRALSPRPRLSPRRNLSQIGLQRLNSLRRQALLQALRPDLKIEPLRGNVNTRLRKLDEGQYDAIVLAAAVLRQVWLVAG